MQIAKKKLWSTHENVYWEMWDREMWEMWKWGIGKCGQ